MDVTGWGGESLVERADAETGARIFVAIHSSRLGPPSGGTRMRHYPDRDAARRDAMRLSEGMTYKWAAAGFPRGGAKGVIAIPADLDPRARPDLLRRYGLLVQELGGRFWTGPDVGTSSEDMDVIAETGAPYIFGRTPAHGGPGDSGPWTSLSVFACIEVTCARLFGAPSVAGRRVLVQGAGSVGGRLIEMLAAAGAAISVSDVDPAALRRAAAGGHASVAPDDVIGAPGDIFAPCALGGVLDEKAIGRLACRAVVGAANNQLATPEDAGRLAARGILYAPDFVVNAGGAIAVTGIEAMGWSPERADREVRAIGGSLARIFEMAQAEGITTEAAARRIADERLRAGPPSAGSP